MTTYFAYGANMDPVHMAACCPGAARLGGATLAAHRFGIAAGGYATARPDRDRHILGVLWRLTPADEAALDAFEGVPAGLYRKARVRVLAEDGGEVVAMIYRATDDAPGRPAPGYLERVVEVAELLGFPESYRGELVALSAS